MDLFYAIFSLLVIFLIVSVIRFKLKLSRVVDLFEKRYNSRMHDRKKLLFESLNQLKAKRGDGKLVILEIGSGAGANFEYYPPGSEVICVDLDRHVEPILRDTARHFPEIRVSEFHAATVENMRGFLENESVDAAVCTLVLCCVSDMARGLHEILRVLKPVSILLALLQRFR